MKRLIILFHGVMVCLSIGVGVNANADDKPRHRQGQQQKQHRGRDTEGRRDHDRPKQEKHSERHASVSVPSLIQVLDANHDGVLDKQEIASAADSLRKLDKNDDDKVTIDEAVGQGAPHHGFGPPSFGPPSFGPPKFGPSGFSSFGMHGPDHRSARFGRPGFGPPQSESVENGRSRPDSGPRNEHPMHPGVHLDNRAKSSGFDRSGATESHREGMSERRTFGPPWAGFQGGHQPMMGGPGSPAMGGPPSPNKMLQIFDRDKDGKITREEARGPLASRFDRIDSNKDGILDESELRAIPGARQ